MGGTELFIGQAVLGVLQKSQATRAQNRQLSAQQAIQEQRIAATRQVEERRRKEQLRRNKAAQRARFGGLGLSSSGGSAAAVLRGLSTRSSLEGQDRDLLSGIELNGLRQDFDRRRRRNLLEVRKNAFNTGFSLLRQGISRLNRS